MVSLVLVLVSWLRAKRDRARIVELEKESARALERLFALERKLEEPSPSPEHRPAEPEARPLPEPRVQPPVTTRGDLAAEAPETVRPAAARAREPAPEYGPAPKKAEIEWEQWLGVRGFALVGAILFALAGLLFVKISIDRGWISPLLRVAIALITGIAALGVSETLRKRKYLAASNGLAGAGVVVLYAAVWAARVLYGLIPGGLALVLMVLVTAVCGLLSWRRESLVVALLGLIGGFATPALLSTGSNNPIGLFGYLLLLNLGVLFLGRYLGRPSLGLLSLAATIFYQGAWIFERMGSDQAMLGLLILGVFGGLFAVFAGGTLLSARETPSAATWWTRAAGILFPFAFAFYFAARSDLGEHFFSLGALLVLLALLAQWVGRMQKVPWIPVGAAAAGVAVTAVWLARSPTSGDLRWEIVGVTVAFALTFHVFAEIALARKEEGPARAASIPVLLAAAGLLGLLVLKAAVASPPSLWAWLTGWIALAGILYRISSVPGREWAQLPGALGLGSGLALFFATRYSGPVSPSLTGLLATGAVLGMAYQGLALVSRKPGAAMGNRTGDRAEIKGRWAEIAAAAFPMMMLVGLLTRSLSRSLSPTLFLGASIVFALLGILAVTRLPSGRGYFLVIAVTAAVQAFWAGGSGNLGSDPSVAIRGLTLQGLTVILFTAWPFLAGRRLLSRPGGRYAAALAGPLWFFSLRELFVNAFGERAIGLLPLALAALALAAAFRIRAIWPPGEAARKSALVWFSAVALAFVALAVPLQLDHEWVTVAWALQGLAILALWQRLDHPGLKYFGLGLLAVATLRLVQSGVESGYPRRAGPPIVNWLLYTYLVPAAALLASARILAPLEIERKLSWETAIYRGAKPIAGGGCALAAIGVVFFWINLTLDQAFSAGGGLELGVGGLAARDLSLSLAWAVYALILLAIGIRWKSAILRWISLGLLVLTIGKAFLYDLSELTGLYRVGSLLGLAVSLLLVSLAYQRFVRSPGGETGDREAPDEETP